MHTNKSQTNKSSNGMRGDLAALLFLTLFGTYGYFWQSRDWNAASRLMLTYSLVDRHQVHINGLEQQAGYGEVNPFTGRYEMVDGDLARLGPRYYSDKAPGQSFLGALPYSVGRFFDSLPPHPLNDEAARAYWPADYVVTWATSGLLTAALSIVIYAFALALGATQRAGVLLGLAYGLATPALVYATLFYGHQASAFCTVTSFFLLYQARRAQAISMWRVMLSGLLAGYSVVIEYQTAIISAVIGLYAIVTLRRVGSVLVFALAAFFSAGLLAAYNYKAFGDPLDLGYAHEVSRQFRAIHSDSNPLGIRVPDIDTARQVLTSILWGPFRGLLFYAPVVCAAPLGLLAMLWRRQWGPAVVCLAAIAWMLAVNVSYPLWEGGWCTGPRLIVPAIPFAVLLVGGLLGAARHPLVHWLIGIATIVGTVLMLSCVAVGGRFPPDAVDLASPLRSARIENPVREIVIPHWSGGQFAEDRAEVMRLDQAFTCSLCGRHPTSFLAGGRQFERNAGHWLMQRVLPDGVIPAEPSVWQALQFAPLTVFLILMASLLITRSRPKQTGPGGDTVQTSSDQVTLRKMNSP